MFWWLGKEGGNGVGFWNLENDDNGYLLSV